MKYLSDASVVTWWQKKNGNYFFYFFSGGNKQVRESLGCVGILENNDDNSFLTFYFYF